VNSITGVPMLPTRPLKFAVAWAVPTMAPAAPITAMSGVPTTLAPSGVRLPPRRVRLAVAIVVGPGWPPGWMRVAVSVALSDWPVAAGA